MENKENRETKTMQKILLEKHPNWTSDKARWVAMKLLGVIS